MKNHLITEINRQLNTKSEILSVGPPEVILNGEKLLIILVRAESALEKVVNLTTHGPMITDGAIVACRDALESLRKGLENELY